MQLYDSLNIIWQCLFSVPNSILKKVKVHETGCSGLVHWDDPGGWDGEGGGRGVLDAEHMCARG